MKLANEDITIEGDALFDQQTPMTIDEASMRHIFRSLTEIYSDPYRSIAREYAGNAYDSHIEAGQTKPIDFYLPTPLSPNFVIRDYGVGMSREELTAVYSKYGASTKRNTNSQIGAFGLGSKSALAIVPSFIVVSVKDGKKNSIIVSKGEDGVPVFNFIDEIKSDELNGVAIEIPIRETSRIEKALRGTFAGWPAGMARIDGIPVGGEYQNADEYTPLGDVGFVVNQPKQNNNRYHYNQDEEKLKVLVGPVSYTLDAGELREILGNDLHNIKAPRSNIVLRLPIGSVEFTPSREKFIINKQTKTAVKTAMVTLLEKLDIHTQSIIDSAVDRSEALITMDRLYYLGIDKASAEWRGEKIPFAPKENQWDRSQRIQIFKPSVKAKELCATDLRSEYNRNNNGSTKIMSSHTDLASQNRFGIDSYALDHTKQKVVVVINAGEANKARYNVMRDILAYAKSNGYAPGPGVDKTDKLFSKVETPIRFIITPQDENSLSDWGKDLVTVIDASVIKNEAKRLKKEREAAAALLSANDPKPVVKKTITLPILEALSSSDNTDPTPKASLTDISTLPKDAKFIVTQEFATPFKLKLTSEDLSYSIIEDILYQSSRGNHSSSVLLPLKLQAGIITVLKSAGYYVVSLPKSRKKERVTEELGETYSFETALRDSLSQVNSFSELELNWMGTQNYLKGWIKLFAKTNKQANTTYLDEDRYSLVENAETREWIKVGLKTKDEPTSRGEVMKAIYDMANARISGRIVSRDYNSIDSMTKLYWGFDSEIANKLSELIQPASYNSESPYPLINEYSSASPEDIAEYINMRDSKHKA